MGLTRRLANELPFRDKKAPIFGAIRIKFQISRVRQAGIEPTTFGSGGQRSIQLSYWRIFISLITYEIHDKESSNIWECS